MSETACNNNERNQQRINIAKNVKKIRKQKNIRQKEMALWLGIKESSYSMKESAKRTFGGEELAIIFERLDIDANEVYKRNK